jgi:hypothetical protein
MLAELTISQLFYNQADSTLDSASVAKFIDFFLRCSVNCVSMQYSLSQLWKLMVQSLDKTACARTSQQGCWPSLFTTPLSIHTSTTAQPDPVDPRVARAGPRLHAAATADLPMWRTRRLAVMHIMHEIAHESTRSMHKLHKHNKKHNKKQIKFDRSYSSAVRYKCCRYMSWNSLQTTAFVS